MIKFIVVEDDRETQNHIQQIINNTLSKKEINYDISMHLSKNKALQKVIEDDSCRKIYILDIELNHKQSGIDIAKEIRQKDWDSEIIFITSHDHMFESAYRNVYKVFNFIEKFHDFDNRLIKNITEIIDTKYDNGIFKYHGSNLDLFIHYKEILYLYRDKTTRKMILKTTKNKFIVNLGVKEALDYLDGRFKLIHRACIVNLEKVDEFNWNEGYFLLVNGEKVYMLSKKYKKDIRGI